MKKNQAGKQIIPLLRESINTIIAHPLILIPFVTIAFVQLLCLEILYFSPRQPLVAFFGPIIQNRWGDLYVHYPFHLLILPRLFQFTQIITYIFISSYILGAAILIISAINSNKKITFKSALRDNLNQYVHIFVAASISFLVYYGVTRIYGLIIARAYQIRSEVGIFYMIKSIVIQGAPFFNLLLGVLVTTLFAFVFPIIVIEGKKVFTAIIGNFKHLWRSFWFMFFVVLVPHIFYIPVLLLRNNVTTIADATFPAFRALMLVMSILMMMMVDASVYTAITTYYLMKKEQA